MPRYKALEHSNLWIRICQSVMYPLTRMVGKREYRGMERLHRTCGMLVVGNHISHLDPVFDTVMIHKAGRIPHVLAKASLWKIPVVGTALRGTGQIPVERGGGGGQTAVETATQVLHDDGLVLIYPEGTVSKEPDFWPMRPRPGVAVLAMSTSAAVVPIVNWGTQHVYNSYAEGSKLKLFPRQRILVSVGPDIDVSAYHGRQSDPRAIMDVSMLIMNTIADMLAEIRGEQRPAQLFDPKKAARLAQLREQGGPEPESQS